MHRLAHKNDPPGHDVPRHGFTLVELCVVIGILGLLAAIIVPAVQAVRETSRRTTCANNLRQVALAFQSHAETYGVFPGIGFERQGWGGRIAPFLELPQPLIGENGEALDQNWPPPF